MVVGQTRSRIYTRMRTNRIHPGIGEVFVVSYDDPTVRLRPTQDVAIGRAPQTYFAYVPNIPIWTLTA